VFVKKRAWGLNKYSWQGLIFGQFESYPAFIPLKDLKSDLLKEFIGISFDEFYI
jgi:hypothetical protein